MISFLQKDLQTGANSEHGTAGPLQEVSNKPAQKISAGYNAALGMGELQIRKLVPLARSAAQHTTPSDKAGCETSALAHPDNSFLCILHPQFKDAMLNVA